jgi:hypothetical protein
MKALLGIHTNLFEIEVFVFGKYFFFLFEFIVYVSYFLVYEIVMQV